MALAFLRPRPCGDTTGGAVGMTAASTRTRVCGPFRTSCLEGELLYISLTGVVSEAAAAMPMGLPLPAVLCWALVSYVTGTHTSPVEHRLLFDITIC